MPGRAQGALGRVLQRTPAPGTSPGVCHPRTSPGSSPRRLASSCGRNHAIIAVGPGPETAEPVRRGTARLRMPSPSCRDGRATFARGATLQLPSDAALRLSSDGQGVCPFKPSCDAHLVPFDWRNRTKVYMKTKNKQRRTIIIWKVGEWDNRCGELGQKQRFDPARPELKAAHRRHIQSLIQMLSGESGKKRRIQLKNSSDTNTASKNLQASRSIMTKNNCLWPIP